MKTVTYTVVIEDADGNFGASVPDLPGCVAVGDSVEEVVELIREAIAFHIEGLRADGETVPPAKTIGKEVQVEVAA